MKRAYLVCFIVLSTHAILSAISHHCIQLTSHTQNATPAIHASVRSGIAPTRAYSTATTAPNLAAYSNAQLKDYFSYYGYTEKHILAFDALYMSDEFVELAKTYPGYEQAIIEIRRKLHNMTTIGK